MAPFFVSEDVIMKHDPFRELMEIRNQLSYAKRVGILLGAGASKAMGLPDIQDLTNQIADKLVAPHKENYVGVKESLPTGQQHVEAILNHVRLIRQITLDSEEKSYDDISGAEAKLLDKNICDAIYDIISTAEATANIGTAKQFSAWLNYLPRDYAKEVFTTNYDLILEKAFEELRVPYFDGFIGAYEPFFEHESLYGKSKYDKPPVSWIRLWKLHGSLGWFWKPCDEGRSHRVIRLSAGAKKEYPDSEQVIYPSRDKYESSRKQPFTSYFDRLKEFLLGGEGVFIISGYSFSDEHVNEIIFNGLNQNNRLHILAFFYDDEPVDRLTAGNMNLPNLTMIGQKKASISGICSEWGDCAEKDNPFEQFWSEAEKSLSLGDYNELVKFLTLCSGIKE